MILEKLAAKFAGNKIGDTISKVMDSADGLFTSKEEKMKLQNEIQAEVNRAIEAERADVLETLKAQLADIQNARQMQIEALRQEDKFSKHFVYYLAAFMIFSSIGMQVLMCFVVIPAENRPIVERTMDVFNIAGAVMVLQFFFGSSVGSRKSSESLRQHLNDKK